MAQTFYFNGIDGETGSWFQEPLAADVFAERIFGSREPGPEQSEEPDPKGLAYGEKPSDLAETGWGVIFPAGQDSQVRAQLQTLLDHRQEAASAILEKRFRIFEYHNGESKLDFLTRVGAPNPGMPVMPERTPYYLLIVGTPQEIPFEFQFRLSTDYAVGRVCFDHPKDYGTYAESVVAWERQQAEPTARNRLKWLGLGRRKAVARERRLVLFGVENHDDLMTRLSVEYLVSPLFEQLKHEPNWRLQKFVGEETEKAQCAGLIGGGQTPDLLLTVGHGLCFRSGSRHQAERQGALVCRGWSGPKNPKPLTRDGWFGAPDIDSNAKLHGLITFHMGCFTAGTPMLDALHAPSQSKEHHLAGADFMAAMPKRLLAHENGGALAVLGHVDRAWEHSFVRGRNEAQVGAFHSCLKALMAGMPVGHAMSFFNRRIPALAEALMLHRMEQEPADVRGLHLWTQYHDARTYVVLGDPACRTLGGVSC